MDLTLRNDSPTRVLGRLLVLVPAHDEADLIVQTLSSVLPQLLRGDRVVVVADDCTDDTAALSLRAGAEVFTTAGNVHKKAGALNQALQALLPALDDADGVLVMDADTVLDPAFLRTARATFARSPVSAVGGVFAGEPGKGLLGLLQRNEYGRYARQLTTTGKVWVLTGTGTVFRVEALRDVVAARSDGRLPGATPQVYDTLALTEDNELTLALKTLGHRLASPGGCRVTTEVMPTVGRLFQQRLRWQRGALENLRHYGLTRVTLPYLGQQLMMMLGTVMLSLYLFLTVLLLVRGGHLTTTPFWLGVSALFVLERVVTVRRQGRLAMAVASLLVVEMAYDALLQLVLVRSALDILRRREARWGTT